MKRAALAACLAGCLGPLDSDRPAPSGQILPAGSVVPALEDDPERAEELAEHDGVDGTIARVSAFAGGAPVHVWDFGDAPDFAAPLFSLVRREGDQLVRVDHPNIIEAIPGDPGYSPYWAFIVVPVTAAYDGELLTSFAAVQEAQELGLVEEPDPVDFAVNCPVTAGDVRLDTGAGGPVAPTARFFYDGMTVPYFDLGPMPVVDQVRVPEAPHYLLRREGGEPLSEPVRGVDITGDGDLFDSNDVFLDAADPGWSPRCRTIGVAVAAATASIDTSGDETVADLRDAAQLFDPDPVAGTVIAFETTDEHWNCAPQVETP